MGIIRIIVIIYFLLSLSLELNAQIQYGVKLGYGLGLTDSDLIRYDDFDDFIIYNINLKNQQASPSISFICLFKDKASNLFFQGEFGFRQLSTNFNIKSDVLTDIREFEEVKKTRYFYIPITGGLIYNQFRAGIGPGISVILSQNNVFEDLQFFGESRPVVESSALAHFGFTHENINIELAYEFFFNGAADYIIHKGIKQGFNKPAHFIYLSAGILF